MSIASRIENMTNNLSNAYDSLEDLGIELENTNRNLQNLSSCIDTLYEELPHTSNTTASSEVLLNNTKKGKIVFQLNGNTYQKQYTGKNLFSTENSLGEKPTRNNNFE